MTNWNNTEKFIVDNLTIQMTEYVNDMISAHTEELNQLIEAKEEMLSSMALLDEVISTSKNKFNLSVYDNVKEEFNIFENLKGDNQEIGAFIAEVSKHRIKTPV